MYLIFDCETIPDAELIKKVYGLEGSDLEVSLEALKLRQEETGKTAFLPLEFHKIVSIAALIDIDEIGRQDIRIVNFKPRDTEREIISNFIQYFEKSMPNLVSFNGKNFDMPLICMRAMKYGFSMPTYFDRRNKWENYRARYDEKFHLDLLQVLGYGSKLDSVCKMLGMPGKYDVDGSEVHELYYQGEHLKIDEYCQSDVLNTYLVFLRYRLLSQLIEHWDYTLKLELLLKSIPEGASYAQTFKDYLKGYLKGIN